MNKDLINNVLEKLSRINNSNLAAFVCYDGYIDKIQQAVEAQKENSQVYFKTLRAFGEKISGAANQSAQIELQTRQVKLGGNAPIMAESLGRLGVVTTCYGSMGYPEMHPVFQQMHSNVFRITAGPAAETNALEFTDGKLILSELSVFDAMDWEFVKLHTDHEVLKLRLQKSSLFAMVGWCNLPHATKIWYGLLDTYRSLSLTGNPTFFFDLADPSKKTERDIKEVVALMGDCSALGNTLLGLNENETHILNHTLGGKIDDSLIAKARFLYSVIPVNVLIIHPTDRSIVIAEDTEVEMMGRLIADPMVSTGGGDNFNAGYCYGLFHDFSIEESMVLAMATSGSYVQNGVSPSINLLEKYLSEWLQELVEET